jgi:CheY-like chemotaxis protein
MNGHAVSEASDGQQAVEMMRSHKFDLVLMDISMPVMDGISATRAIRENESEAIVTQMSIDPLRGLSDSATSLMPRLG